ncbi:MAG TPA: methyltransferase domain-containing protein [Acidimicrobiales bacterium]|nr:methyltransferase domain-containing protein [Acidimicrobiales bacterium]
MGLAKHFMNPRGFGGRVAGWIMGRRGSNVTRNRWVVDLLELGPGDRVLEIGCGPGVAVEAALAAGAEVVAVDPSDVMRAMAAKRNPDATILEGDADHLPEGPFTAAWAVNTVQFWPDVDRTLVDLRGRLAPGGRVALALQPRMKGATDEDARRRAEENAARLTAAGYLDARTEHLDLRPVGCGVALARVS